MLNGKTLLSALCIGLFVVCSQTVSAQVVTDALVASASDKDLTSFITSASQMDEATLKKLFKRVFQGLNKKAATKTKDNILKAADATLVAANDSFKKGLITKECLDAYAKRILILKDVTIGTNSVKGKP